MLTLKIVHNIVHKYLYSGFTAADTYGVSKRGGKRVLGVRGRPLKDPNEWGLLRIRMSKAQEAAFQARITAIAETMNRNQAAGKLVRNNHVAILALEIGLEHLKKNAGK